MNGIPSPNWDKGKIKLKKKINCISLETVIKIEKNKCKQRKKEVVPWPGIMLCNDCSKKNHVANLYKNFCPICKEETM
jgi:hypothetical protein